MKKPSYKLLCLVMIWLFSAAAATSALAQQKLIYYWHFNNLNTGLTKAVSPATIGTIHANYGSIDSTKAIIAYLPVSASLSTKYLTYWDAVAGEASDTFNVRSGATGAVAGNNALRVRNPSDSMQLIFQLPTTKYKNMTLKFATERSSTASGPGKQSFDYSTDGGLNWKTSGMSIPSDSFNNAIWNYVTISFAGDAAVNNNSNFLFRIKLNKPNTGTSGNARFDNITLEGDSIAAPSQKLIHYWHFNNINTGTTKAGSPSLLKPIHANYSSLDSTKALITYVPTTTVSSKYLTYWDNNAGDTINARRSQKNQTTGTNNALRVRNPSDSMSLICYLPTTRYKNINIAYELELSSFGPTGSAGGRELFDYSNDSGKTFTQSGLSITSDSITNGGWNLIRINLSADAKVNNNSKFAFRIRTTAPNSGTSGNHRYDNFTVEGDSIVPPVVFGKPLYKIRQLRGQNATTGVADSLNKGKGYIKGVVQSPSFSATSLQFTLIDSTGAMTVFTSKIKYYTPKIGDSIIVKGTLTQFNGLTEYTADTIALLKSGTFLKTPSLVTKLDEAHESDLVKIKNVHIIDSTTWIGTGSGFNVNIVDNLNDTFSMRITSSIDLFKLKAIKGSFNVTGIETQFKSASPFIGGYQIEPRGVADIELIRFNPLYKIRQVKGQNLTTGVADSLNKGKGYIKGVVHSPSYSTTSLQFTIIDSTGAITVFTSKIKYYTPAIGDSILVKGTLTQFNGLSEYTADTIIILTKSTFQKTPTVVIKMDESYESDLIKIKNVHLIDTTQWTGAGSGFNVTIVDNLKDTFVMRITSAIDLFKKGPIKGNFNVTGIETQFKSASPFIGGYQIEPRGISDIEILIPSTFGIPLYKISQLKGQNATTGVADSLNKGKGIIKGVVHSPSFSATALQFSLIDSTGAITVFTSKIKYYTPAIGDSILVKGTLTQFSGVTEYSADSIIKLTKGTFLKTPTTVVKLDETKESDLLLIKNVHLVDTTQWVPAGSGFNVTIVDNLKDTFVMRITSSVDLFKKGPIKGDFNLTGIETQFKSASPFIGGYEIEPRGSFDIDLITVIIPKPKTPLYKIRQVRGQNVAGVADSATSKNKFFVKGIVQSPSYSLTGENFSLKDSTGTIIIFNTAKLNSYTPAIGDSVQVRGLLTQFNGLTEVTADSISKLTSSSPILSAKVITKMDETVESGLVKFNNAYLVNPTQWLAAGSGFNVDVTNGKDTIQVRITSGVDLFSKPAPKGKFNVTGIVGQFKSASPFIGGYQLMPRGVADIQPIPLKLYTISQVKGYNTTSGIADSINIFCFLKGVVHSTDLGGGSLLFFSLKDNTGAVTVVAPGAVNKYTPSMGDSIKVRGVVRQVNGLTVFAIDSVKTLAAGTATSPVAVTKLDESTESDLVTLNTYKLVDPTKWDTTGANGRFTVKANNGSDTITIAIVKGTNLYLNSAKPASYFDVTGIGSQADATQPYLQNYLIIPRSISDFVHSSGIDQQNVNDDNVDIYPNPASSHIIVESGLHITDIKIMNAVGQVVATQKPTAASTSIDITNIKPGVYFARITIGNNILTKKIVKN